MVFKKFIKKDEWLHILGCVLSQDRAESGLPLPSWVPSFNQAGTCSWLSGTAVACDPAFSVTQGGRKC